MRLWVGKQGFLEDFVFRGVGEWEFLGGASVASQFVWGGWPFGGGGGDPPPPLKGPPGNPGKALKVVTFQVTSPIGWLHVAQIYMRVVPEIMLGGHFFP